jgi:hypothetical protein
MILDAQFESYTAHPLRSLCIEIRSELEVSRFRQGSNTAADRAVAVDDGVRQRRNADPNRTAVASRFDHSRTLCPDTLRRPAE